MSWCKCVYVELMLGKWIYTQCATTAQLYCHSYKMVELVTVTACGKKLLLCLVA